MSKIKVDKTIVFWFVMFAVGIAALITGAVIRGLTGNNLMWLIISFGIVLTLLGGIFATYLLIIRHKRKVIRSKGI